MPRWGTHALLSPVLLGASLPAVAGTATVYYYYCVINVWFPSENGAPAEPLGQVVPKGKVDVYDTVVLLHALQRMEHGLPLGPKGYKGVQISPPNEHIPLSEWWARYQPVSYRLESRGGTRSQVIDMVQRCNAAGVEVYDDLVINHTASLNNGGVGSGGTSWTVRNHPGLYGPQDYRQPTCTVNNYRNLYTLANVFMLGWPYGYAQVMSSYAFTNTDAGPPG